MSQKSSTSKPTAEAVVRDDHRASLYCHQGGRRIQNQDHRAQPALADQLHIFESHRLGWLYLSAILDDYARDVIVWKLCTTMPVEDVTDTLNLALEASGCATAKVSHKPRLLSDNRPCYIAGDLAKWLGRKNIEHIRGAPCHPQTQGKIERWHQTLKNRILLENYYLPGDLERQIAAFIEHYNNRRYHESLGNVAPADAFHGRAQEILREREQIKRQTIQARRLRHSPIAA
jgi:putative transposase